MTLYKQYYDLVESYHKRIYFMRFPWSEWEQNCSNAWITNAVVNVRYLQKQLAIASKFLAYR